jgi:hypothetical protein
VDVVGVRAVGGGGDGGGGRGRGGGPVGGGGDALPRVRMHVTGFTSDVAALMRAADVLVGKPGPGVVSEAYVSGLPCVLLTGAGVMAQEREVVDWAVARGVGVEAAGPADVAAMRRRIKEGPRNEAVFEVARLIAHALPRREAGVRGSDAGAAAAEVRAAGERREEAPAAGAGDGQQVV